MPQAPGGIFKQNITQLTKWIWYVVIGKVNRLLALFVFVYAAIQQHHHQKVQWKCVQRISNWFDHLLSNLFRHV